MLLMPLTFLLASGSAITTNRHLHATMALNLSAGARQVATSNSISSNCPDINDKEDDNTGRKPRILCLHGKFQSGYIFSNKIAGARRKIEREYELHFIDGPILLPTNNVEENVSCDGDNFLANALDERLAPRSWWLRADDGQHTLVREAFEFITQQTNVDQYDALVGFSQGGTLATALALSGIFPNVRAVCTAGAPYIADAFEVASELYNNNSASSMNNGFNVPKLHLAGEADALVAVESTLELCQKGGNGKLILHDQGHLFPTRAARVKEILDFLGAALSVET